MLCQKFCIYPFRRIQNLIHGTELQLFFHCFFLISGNPEIFHQAPAHRKSIFLQMIASSQRGTLQNNLPKQVPGIRPGQNMYDGIGTRRLAEQRHLSGISAERSDISPDPPKRQHLIFHRKIVLTDPRILEKTKGTQPKIHIDHNHMPFFGQLRPVVPFQITPAIAVCSSVEPYGNRQLLLGRRRADCQCQTVFASGKQHRPHGKIQVRSSLRRDRAASAGIPDSFPRFERFRKTKSPASNRRFSVRNPAKLQNSALHDSSDFSAFCFHNFSHRSLLYYLFALSLYCPLC